MTGIGRRALIHDFDEVAFLELTQKRERVVFALARFHVVFIEQLGHDGGDGRWGLNQFPNARTNGIEAVINAVSKVEDGGFTGEVARNLVVAGFDVSGGKDHCILELLVISF